MYKSFLIINLFSLNLRIRLNSYSKIDTSFVFDMIPIELITKYEQQEVKDQAIKTVFSYPWAALVPSKMGKENQLDLFNKLFYFGACAIIVEDDTNAVNDSRAVYTISSPDYKHLISILNNQSKQKTKGSDNILDKIATKSRISKDYSDPLSLIDEFFLQIPPILFVVLIVIIWKSFSSDDDTVYRNFYHYEDFTDGINISCQGCVCCICFEEYSDGAVIRKLGCKHFYHKSCIEYWLARSNFCPICRKDVYRNYNYVQTEVAFI